MISRISLICLAIAAMSLLVLLAGCSNGPSAVQPTMVYQVIRCDGRPAQLLSVEGETPRYDALLGATTTICVGWAPETPSGIDYKFIMAVPMAVSETRSGPEWAATCTVTPKEPGLYPITIIAVRGEEEVGRIQLVLDVGFG